MTEPLRCPNCAQSLPLTTVASAKERSTVRWRVVPAPGELLDARTVGDTLARMRDLLRAGGKDLGVPTEVLVSGVTFDAGAVEFELLIVRFEEAAARRKRVRARGRKA